MYTQYTQKDILTKELIMAQGADTKVSFKDTLNLPTTAFPIRSNPAQEDPRMIDRWNSEKLSEQACQINQSSESFILHDGPPYANGHIHIGHAYNKILKDIVCKSQRMAGKFTPVIPGWDCHGLPIEFKVSSENPGLPPVELKKKCREYAQSWIDIQREEFKKLGVLMDWDHPYITMNPGYEASILSAFGEFVERGYIERKNKTVPWCATCRTVLAAAEIEYADRKDPSLYVLFELEQKATDTLFPSLRGQKVFLVIWTTTPWTLPLNRAVMINPETSYSLVSVNGQYVLVGSQAADGLCTQLQCEKKAIATIHANDLLSAGARAHHPFDPNRLVPLVVSEGVSVAEGTAFVHCAPGCGPEDYEVGVRHGLEIYSPVTVDGKYDDTIIPKELAGMSVTDGQIWVIKQLATHLKLLHKTSIKHSYPHCWRCHNGLIFRATKQWFCDLEKNNLKDRTLTAIEGIETFPQKSKNRLHATVEGRLEWCLSRQRVWGVPIPALLCVNGDYAYTNQEFINKVADKVAQKGIEYWDEVTVKELLPAGLRCPHCNSAEFIKEKDILDVWFDSGISHYAVLAKRAHLPADMYLEGKDQHRGWFQSSLLSSLVINDKAPMKMIMTHGFTVDQQGRKMSKSLGNVVSPEEMVAQLGTDGLRLWASSIDYADDAVVSETLLNNVKEVLRKVRNTCRFLLSNLYDYHHEKDHLPLEQLMPIDIYALQELQRFVSKVSAAYAEFDFTAVYHAFADYCASDLSSFYLDIIKDRLYVELANGQLRRSAQTTCWYILDTLTKWIAPILSFNAEMISDEYQRGKKESIHLQRFSHPISPLALMDPMVRYHASDRVIEQTISYETAYTDVVAQKPFINTVDSVNRINEYDRQWESLKKMRSCVLKAIELQREKGVIKHSLEARVAISFNWFPFGQALEYIQKNFPRDQQNEIQFLKEFFIVSQISLGSIGKAQSGEPEIHIQIDVAQGAKCPRCWQWDEMPQADGLCRRCAPIVASIRK